MTEQAGVGPASCFASCSIEPPCQRPSSLPSSSSDFVAAEASRSLLRLHCETTGECLAKLDKVDDRGSRRRDRVFQWWRRRLHLALDPDQLHQSAFHLYLKKHPETAQHVAGATAKHGATAKSAVAESFAEDTLPRLARPCQRSRANGPEPQPIFSSASRAAFVSRSPRRRRSRLRDDECRLAEPPVVQSFGSVCSHPIPKLRGNVLRSSTKSMTEAVCGP